MTEMNQHPLWSAQLQLEEEMRSMGISRFREQVAEAKTKGQESRTQTVRRIMGHVHQDVVEGINAFVAAAESGKAGRKHSALKFVTLLEVDLVAHLTCRSVMDSVSTQETLPRAAIDLATLLEDEIHFRAFEEQKPGDFKARKKAVEKGGTDARRRRNAMLIPARKMGVQLDEWSPREKLLVGTKLIEIFVERTGLAQITRVSEGRANTPIYVRATQATLDWIAKENNRMEWMQPIYLPTIIPPKPWTTPYDGGYWSGRVRRLTMVKCHNNRQYLDELAGREMPQVYASLNALQETPWAINARVLSVMTHMWDEGLTLGVKDMPKLRVTTTDNDAPKKPYWLTPELTRADMSDEQLQEFRMWKSASAQHHEAEAKAVSKRMAFARMLMVARKFEQQEEFFYPHQLDWRGRIYPVALYLHPQGNDAQRGLLEFARAVPLNDDDGVTWLAVHGAGLWGVDKVSFEARRAWIEENQDAILASAADPLENRFWTTAEKPWSALAFCFDWAGWVAEGYAFESCLPVQMDGTCNGLQNFSAILRDEVGGAAVNLVPSDKPQDIYTEVASLVSKLVEADLENTTRIVRNRLVTGADGVERKVPVEGPEIRELARGWVGNVTRKVTKRPVMTLAYGAREFGFKTQVFEDTVAPWKAKADGTFPFEGTGWEAAAYMGELIWEAVRKVVVAAASCMEWLQKAARVAAVAGLPVLWTTPTGFLVQQAYRLPNQKRIETTFETIRIQLSIDLEESKIDSRKQASGISPNWVHSLDASHMMRTIARCSQDGIRSFCMIHDSYGTHAGNAQVLAMALREEFVSMYEGDVLAKFRDDLMQQLPEGAELEALPSKGSLDLSAVLESPFFFA